MFPTLAHSCEFNLRRSRWENACAGLGEVIYQPLPENIFWFSFYPHNVLCKIKQYILENSMSSSSRRTLKKRLRGNKTSEPFSFLNYMNCTVCLFLGRGYDSSCAELDEANFMQMIRDIFWHHLRQGMCIIGRIRHWMIQLIFFHFSRFLVIVKAADHSGMPILCQAWRLLRGPLC